MGRLTVSIALLLASGAAELVVFSGGHGPIRIGLAIAFLMIAPGWATQQLVGLEADLLTRVGLVLALSLGIDMAVATALLYAHLWSAEVGLSIVALVVVVAVILDLPTLRHAISRSARRALDALSELGRP